jgi:hypothetical protein
MSTSSKKYIQILLTFLTPYISAGSGAIAAWILVKLHVLGIIHLTNDQLAKAIASLVIFAITSGLTYLTAHTKLLPLLEKWVELDIIGGLPQKPLVSSGITAPSPPVVNITIQATKGAYDQTVEQSNSEKGQA